MKTLLFLGHNPFMVRVQLPRFWRVVRFDAIDEIKRAVFDVIVGVDVYEDHGPCWCFMVGNLELRYWLGAWTDPRTRERFSGRAG